MGRPQAARKRARAQQARVLRLLSRDSERRRVARRETRDAGMALETAACTSHHGSAPKERGPSAAQCHHIAHEPTTTSAARRARSSKLECCASSSETASAGAPAPRDTRRWLGFGGHNLHVTPQARAEGERPLAGAMPSDRSWADHNQRGTARARNKLEYYASSPATLSAGAPRESRDAGLALETAASTSHHKRSKKERRLSPEQRRSVVHGPTPTSAARRARAATSSSAPPPKRQRAQARLRRVVTRGACLALDSAACTVHHGRAPKERGLSPAPCPLIGHEPTTSSAERRARSSNL